MKDLTIIAYFHASYDTYRDAFPSASDAEISALARAALLDALLEDGATAEELANARALVLAK